MPLMRHCFHGKKLITSRALCDHFAHCSVGCVSLLIFNRFVFSFKEEELLELLPKNGVKDFKETQASSRSSSGRNATEEGVAK